MAGPKRLTTRGFGIAAARRREREAERATERQPDVAAAVPVASAAAGGAPAQNEPVALAPDQSTAPVNGSTAERARGDERPRNPNTPGA
jgi:hypothetical protein